MNRSWAVLLVFLGVFLAGAVTGGFVSLRYAKTYVQKKGAPEQFETAHLKRLTENLKLTDEQQARVKPYIEAASADFKQLRRDTGLVFRKMDEKIAVELTPEQRVKLEEMQRRWLKRADRPPGSPPPDGPPPVRVP
jgi:Spy/CpxP family protein refolding chaperone